MNTKRMINTTMYNKIYYTNKQLSEKFNMSLSTVYRRKLGIMREKKRYGDYAVISSGTNYYAFIDYDKYYKELSEPALRKRIPPYDPVAIAKQCGHI